MKPYMIPLSTAKYAPSWYHQGKGQGFQWKDKNGVWNGLRAPEFAPGPMCEGLCSGQAGCLTHDPNSCLFLRTYRYQLNQLDHNNILQRCKKIANQIKTYENFQEEPMIILLVHEAPNNPCSERKIIQNWFADNGTIVKEWSKNDR